MRSIEEALKLREIDKQLVLDGGPPIYKVSIVRETRYYAYLGGICYSLENDWKTSVIDEQLDALEIKP